MWKPVNGMTRHFASLAYTIHFRTKKLKKFFSRLKNEGNKKKKFFFYSDTLVSVFSFFFFCWVWLKRQLTEKFRDEKLHRNARLFETFNPDGETKAWLYWISTLNRFPKFWLLCLQTFQLTKIFQNFDQIFEFSRLIIFM